MPFWQATPMPLDISTFIEVQVLNVVLLARSFELRRGMLPHCSSGFNLDCQIFSH
jgi:hypothetical protein